MPELDSLRGIAVLMVVFYHGLYWSSNTSATRGLTRLILLATQPGWLGVELFFVLSGFLITGILLDTRDRVDYFRRFYVRRALRILPAYVALIVILLAVGQIRWPFAAISLAFLANVSGLLGVPLQYGPLWSLAVEEHFYLLWPTCVRRLSRRSVLLLAASLVVITPILRALAFATGKVDGLYGYTWFMVDGLAIGACTAVFVRDPRISRRQVALVAAATAALSVAIFAGGLRFGILTRTRLLGAAFQYTPWILLFAAVLLSLLLIGSTQKHSQWVEWPVLAFFGEISYGLYLIHLLVFSFIDSAAKRMAVPNEWWHANPSGILVRFGVAFGLSTLIAAASRWIYEERFLALKDRGSTHVAGGVMQLETPPLASVEQTPA
jgi:peptidoglycan/LPS O-acetylase OafA/YrhL